LGILPYQGKGYPTLQFATDRAELKIPGAFVAMLGAIMAILLDSLLFPRSL
jgi:hypothetical protein